MRSNHFYIAGQKFHTDRGKKERLDQTIVNNWGIFNQLKFQTRKWHYSDSIYRIQEISEMPSELQIDQKNIDDKNIALSGFFLTEWKLRFDVILQS